MDFSTPKHFKREERNDISRLPHILKRCALFASSEADYVTPKKKPLKEKEINSIGKFILQCSTDLQQQQTPFISNMCFVVKNSK